MNDIRKLEVQRYLNELQIECDEDEIVGICCELDDRSKGSHGCLSIGGSSVKDWIRIRLRRKTPVGEQEQGSDLVTAVLHFWSWDEEKYGPWAEPGRESRVSRSPILNLQDAHPINATTHKVARRK
jgi:hypothetical protein